MTGVNPVGRTGLSRLRRLAFLLVLPALLAGCFGYRTAVVPRPGNYGLAEEAIPHAAIAKVGTGAPRGDRGDPH